MGAFMWKLLDIQFSKDATSFSLHSKTRERPFRSTYGRRKPTLQLLKQALSTGNFWASWQTFLLHRLPERLMR